MEGSRVPKVRPVTLSALLAILSLFASEEKALGAPPAAGGEVGARLVVSMVDEFGRAIYSERYLAAVPEASSWNEPARERQLEDGDTAEAVAWILPAGVYRLVCSADGYWVSYGETFELEAGEERVMSCEPIPTDMVKGRVLLAESGEGLEGVTIGPAGLFSPNTDHRLSKIGYQHLRRISLVKSRADGTYELPRPRDYSAALWAEKPGWEPAFRPSAVPDGETGEWPLLEMRPGGGSLSVALSTPSGFPRDRYRLILLPLGAGRKTPLPSYLEQIPFPKNDDLTWSSLPSGRYALLLQARGAETTSGGPETLGYAQVRGPTHISVAVLWEAAEDREGADGKTSILIEGLGEKAL